MSKTNAFSKNTRKEPREGNFVKEVTLDLDNLLKIEREEGTEKTWPSIEEKFGKEMADEKRAEYLRVWEFLTKTPKPGGLSAEWYEKYKGKPFSWEGFDGSFGKAKQEGSMLPEEVEDSFQRLLQRKEIIADPKLVKDLPVIAPYQLDKRYFVEETETSTEIIKKYQRQFGNETDTYIFFIPKAEYKENRIPTFGGDMRKALLIACAFAKEQKSLSPMFRKQHIFRLQGKEDSKISRQMYANLDNGWKTLAYATYEIENKKKGKEYRKRIGHIIDNVDWIGKGRGAFINPTLNRKYFSNLAASIEEETGYQFLSIPKDRVTGKRSRDEDNFLNYIDSLKGMREIYPIQIKTIFVVKLGYRIETLRKIASGNISKILNKCLERAKVTGRLKHWRLDYRGNPSFRNILNWKIKLFLSREE